VATTTVLPLMPLLLFAAASFACLNPTHSDGDNIRCANIPGAMRLHGIDAPEMPGSCRPGRACTPGDPWAARDQLRSLTRGRDVVCEQVDTDDYGRRVVECRADGQSIGCAMVASGKAVERYGYPDCSAASLAPEPEATPDWPAGEPPRPGRVDPPAPPRIERALPPPRVPEEPARVPILDTTRADLAYGGAVIQERFLPKPPPLLALGWLFLINIIGVAMMAIDKARATASARQRVRRIPESTLLAIAAVGGSAGVTLAQQLLRHKTVKQPFARNLLLITGLQIGAILGILVLGF
jgi:uncharacterized membrane protein YsdA (DUF1294 family)